MSSSKFKELLNRNWQQKLYDFGTDDWRKQWFLDGERAEVKNTESGMVFSGGP